MKKIKKLVNKILKKKSFIDITNLYKKSTCDIFEINESTCDIIEII